jgi:hypothetical protein
MSLPVFCLFLVSVEFVRFQGLVKKLEYADDGFSDY